MAKRRVKVRKGDTVKVQYKCRLENGTEIDSSVGREPLEFTLGTEEVIKGLEEIVAAIKVGESKTVNVSAEKAYGPYHDEWVLEVGRDKLPQGWKPEVGLHFELPLEEGRSSTALVTHVSQSSVTLDFNHPLAGRDLAFEVEVAEINETRSSSRSRCEAECCCT
jgi:FKBP-type peptidyl-prolyl cis-trans isomerase 2